MSSYSLHCFLLHTVIFTVCKFLYLHTVNKITNGILKRNSKSLKINGNNRPYN